MSLEKDVKRIADALEAIAAMSQETVRKPKTEEPQPDKKPKKSKKKKPGPKPEKKEVKEDSVDGPEEDAEVVTPPAEPEEKPADNARLKEAIRKAVTSKGKPEALKILSKFGYDPVAKRLPKENYNEAIKELEKG